MTAPDPTTAEAHAAEVAAALRADPYLAAHIRDARSTEDPCEHWVGQEVAVCAPCLRDRLAYPIAAALVAAGLPPASGLAAAIEAEFDALRLAVDELCPHGPEQHAEGTCQTCDTAFAVDAAIQEAAENIAGLLAANPAPVPDQQAVAAWDESAINAFLLDAEGIGLTRYQARRTAAALAALFATNMAWTVTHDTRPDEPTPWGRVLDGEGRAIAHWQGTTQRDELHKLVDLHNAAALATGQGPDTGGEGDG